MEYTQLARLLVTESVYDRIKEQEAALFRLLPELQVCKGFDQRNSWHTYDVYEHILHVVAGVETDKILRLTALFHDIGKPPVFTLDADGVGHFFGHWDASREIFQRYAPRLGLSPREIALIDALIFYHDMNVDKMTDAEIRTMVAALGKENLPKLFAIKRSDLLAQSSAYHHLLANLRRQEQTVLEAAV